MRNAIIVPRLVWHVLVAVFKMSVLMPYWDATRRRAEIAAWARHVFTLLGVRLTVRDAPQSQTVGMLFAGNHVSWLDIFALLASADVRFVAKAELRDWPVIGWLAAQLGTHFIARGSRCEAHAAAQVVSGMLEAGLNVCVFPEGSTTNGAHLQPFRTALFEAAVRSAACVQPFAIRYIDDERHRADAAAFVGDMSLIESIRRLLNARDVTCELSFHTAIASAGLTRRQLALETESCVADELGLEVFIPIVKSAAPVSGAADDLAIA